MPSSHKLLLLNSNRPQEQGFILAVVVIVGLILAAGAMAMMARSTSGLLGLHSPAAEPRGSRDR